MTMTGPERLLAALKGEAVDRVPVWLLYPPGRHPAYVDIHSEPTYAPVIAAARDRTDWFHRVGLSGTVVSGGSPRERLIEDTPERRLWEMETPRGRLTWGRERRGSGWLSIPRIKEPDDFRMVLSAPWEPPTYDFSEFFGNLHSQPAHVLPMTEFSDALSDLYHACRHVDLALWAVTEPDLVDAFIAEMHRRRRHLLREAIRAGLRGVFWLFGTEFAAPPMCSPRTFARLTRFDHELVEEIHGAGGLCPAHHHGDIRDLLPVMRDLGLDGVHPIEAPPTGDCPAAAIRPAVGERFCVIGNVQYDDLARKPPEEIRRQVIDLLDAVGPRSVIVAPTAGPYEPRLSPRMAENYLALIDAAHEWSERHIG